MKNIRPFKVGQVVRVNTEYYRNGEQKSEQYQRIVKVFSWPEYKAHPWGYVLLNGDQANGKYLAALSKKEIGGGSK